MMRNKLLISAFALLFALVPVKAQNSTASPFSIYGIGEIDDNEYGENAAMGSVSIGLRQNNTYYTGNPASLTSINWKNTHIEGAMTFKVSDFSNKNSEGKNLTGNMQLATIATKLSQKWGGAVGVKPYSRTGYFLQNKTQLEGAPGYDVTTEFKGSGSIAKIFLANAYQITPKLSVGVNTSLLYGSISQTEKNQGWSIDEIRNVHKVYVDGGIQYQDSINTKLVGTIGIVGGYSTDFKMHNRLYVLDGDNGLTVDKNQTPTHMTIPSFFGIGASISTHSGWIIAADYKFQNWSKMKTGSDVFRYQDVNKISIGASYVPNILVPLTYLEIIQFQVGASISNSVMSYKGQNGKNASISAGAIFPLRNSCNINAAIEVGKMGFCSNMQENYLKLTLGITFRDFWYLKRQYD